MLRFRIAELSAFGSNLVRTESPGPLGPSVPRQRFLLPLMFRPGWEDLLTPVFPPVGPRFGWGLQGSHCLACQHAVQLCHFRASVWTRHSFEANCVYQRVADRPGIRSSYDHLTTLGTVWRHLLERDGVALPRHCFVCAYQFAGGRLPDPDREEEWYCSYEANCRTKRRRVGPRVYPIFLESSSTPTEEAWNLGDLEHPNVIISGDEANRRIRRESVGPVAQDPADACNGWGVGLPSASLATIDVGSSS